MCEGSEALSRFCVQRLQGSLLERHKRSQGGAGMGRAKYVTGGEQRARHGSDGQAFSI